MNSGKYNNKLDLDSVPGSVRSFRVMKTHYSLLRLMKVMQHQVPRARERCTYGIWISEDEENWKRLVPLGGPH